MSNPLSAVSNKTLLKAAKVAHQIRAAHAYGLDTVQPNIDPVRLIAHVRNVVIQFLIKNRPMFFEVGEWMS